MSGPRQILKDALSGVRVNGARPPIHDGRLPEQITGPALALGVEEVEPAGIARMRKWSLWLAVLTQLQSEGVDDALEELLTEVLNAIDAAQPLTWTTAKRTAVKDDAYHALAVTVTVTTQEV